MFNQEKRQKLQAAVPNTFNSLTWLVPAMEDAGRIAGKKTLFGKDKFAPAYSKVMQLLVKTIQAMEQDGLTGPGITKQETYEELLKIITFFAEAYPNWSDAYIFFNAMLHDKTNRPVHSAIEKYIKYRDIDNTNYWNNYIKSQLGE